MAKVSINGTTYEVPDGASVSIVDDVVRINGRPLDTSANPPRGIVSIRWEGPVGDIRTDASVHCGAVGGSVNAGGSVEAYDVAGNVSAGGSVKCDHVGGSVVAGGSVKLRK